jgi:hypothetical protein
MRKAREVFESFMNTRQVLELFKKELEEHGHHTYEEMFTLEPTPEMNINGSFEWDKTENTFRFWNDLDTEWLEVCAATEFEL